MCVKENPVRKKKCMYVFSMVRGGVTKIQISPGRKKTSARHWFFLSNITWNRVVVQDPLFNDLSSYMMTYVFMHVLSQPWRQAPKLSVGISTSKQAIFLITFSIDYHWVEPQFSQVSLVFVCSSYALVPWDVTRVLVSFSFDCPWKKWENIAESRIQSYNILLVKD